MEIDVVSYMAEPRTNRPKEVPKEVPKAELAPIKPGKYTPLGETIVRRVEPGTLNPSEVVREMTLGDLGSDKFM